MRSSSYGGYNVCEHKTFLNYVLGLPDVSGKAADMGNIFHKVMECLAIGKLKHQETGEVGGWNIGDNYIGEYIPTDIFDNSNLNNLCQLSFDYYKSISKAQFTKGDLKKSIEWLYKAVELQNGMFDPRNREILAVENYFDFEIDKPWAAYDYKIGDKRIQGNLALKGTVDLILKVDDDHLEILDYKTGSRKDFATEEVKTYNKLQKDPQLLIYYYACRHIFPHIKYFDFTIYYVNDGGPFTMCFDDDSFELAERVIQKRFEEMRDNESPKLRSPTREQRENKKNFKCFYCCDYNKNKHPGTDLSICEFFQKEIETKGLEIVTAEHCDWDKLGKYQDGGGKKAE